MILLDELGDNPIGTPVYEEYEAPPIRRSEVLRYGGVAGTKTACADSPLDEKEGDPPYHMETLLDDVLTQAGDVFTYRVAWLRCRTDEGILAEYFSGSHNLMKNLARCPEAVVFAATVGAGIDRMIRRYERTSPARSLLFQALGAERVEALCDRFNEDLTASVSASGWITHPRFSPGYGDLSLDIQPVLLSLLDAGKRLGITLGSSYLMSPSKSVTAIIGLERNTEV